jgi:hypothetical protein
MSRLQSIENALKEINETVFQELCDSFLLRKNPKYRAFSRTGSQQGKQKTIKGTPDTLLLLPNGKYLFVEYSTNISAGVNKLVKDITNCIDYFKTTISPENIEEIILCINFKLKTNEIEILNKVLNNTNINLTINTLDSLAMELHLQHRDLARDYLGISLDTGQIVSMDVFISEYNRASRSIATPLDNQFLHRESELYSLKTYLLKHDFIILTGAPGVGKTKLVLESIKNFVTENPLYQSFCISYKHHSLLDDLNQYFNDDKDYILFVDDANRIDAFNQILGFNRAIRKGNLKIICTVRDYAYESLKLLCSDFSPHKLHLQKLSDEQIADIIKAEPFNIKNYDYLNTIVNIANGNPRIAIMATQLAVAKKDINILNDISGLFEMYFSSFIKDNREFSNDFNIKCLGLIAFFHTIPFHDRETTESILNHFNIGYSDFFHAIEKLDRLELVEIQHNHVKIAEQNLAIYFFYRTFVKDKLLSFDILVDNYFESHQKRFDENVISANNMFDNNHIKQKLYDSLVRYWNKVRNTEEEKAIKFLSSFWFYLQNQTLEYIYLIIQPLQNLELDQYNVSYESNDFVYDQNKIIKLLGHFFRNTAYLKESVELAFEYAKKKPEHLPEVIHKIVEVIGFDREDESIDFLRQSILFEYLIENLQTNETIYAAAFFELSKTFLKIEFTTHGLRKNIVTSRTYHTPNDKKIQKLRENIWITINQYFSRYPKQALNLLENFGEPYPGISIELMMFDMPFVFQIIEQHLQSESFVDCRYVQNQVELWKKHKIKNETFSRLLSKYTNDVYKAYLKLDWDRIRDKERYDYEDYREYERLKEEEIRSSFVFCNVSEATKFYNTFKYLKNQAANDYEYNNSLDIVIDENYKHNEKLGLAILMEVMKDDNSVGYIPIKIFQNNLKNEKRSISLWKTITKGNYQHQASCKVSYFYYLDDSLVNNSCINQLIGSIKNINERTYIDFKYLHKFLKIESSIFYILIKIITDKKELESIEIIAHTDFLEEGLDLLNNDVELTKKLYVQQSKIHRLYDYDGKIFLNILEQDTSFLTDYTDYFYKDDNNKNSGNSKKLKFIWQINDIESSLSKTLDHFASKESYLIAIGTHDCNVFFENIDIMHRERAATFLRKYCINNYKNPDRMNLLINIVRHSFNELFEQMILLFLTLTQDVKLFEQIYWIGNGGTVVRGDVIFGDINAAEWRNILSIVNRSSIGISLLPIKRHINDKIDHHLEYAEWERKRSFFGAH